MEHISSSSDHTDMSQLGSYDITPFDKEILECIDHINNNAFINTGTSANNSECKNSDELINIITDTHMISRYLIKFGNMYDIYVLIMAITNVMLTRQCARNLIRFDKIITCKPFSSAIEIKCNEFDKLTLLGYIIEITLITYIKYINNTLPHIAPIYNIILNTQNIEHFNSILSLFEDEVYGSLDTDEFESRMELKNIDGALKIYDPLDRVRDILFEIAILYI
jgi:hypothetical protein